MKHKSKAVSRRTFVKTAIVGTAAASMDLTRFPSIVPSSVFGAYAPSNRVNIGAIGNGRISRGHDLPGVWRYDEARVMAVCDLDSKRAEDAKALVNDYYSKKTNTAYKGVTTYTDYRELLPKQGHRRCTNQHARSLAFNHRHRRRRSREGCIPSETGITHNC